jgi:peptidoglycan/LPS O-acetylase OafA/YrhL
MTLDKTQTFKRFLFKRWLRLFPAMLIASVLIYLTLPIFHERPDGIPPNIWSILPGLTFTLPTWWSNLLGFEIPLLESAFWSLYVEVKFYVIAGFVYYFLGRKYLVPVLVALFAIWIIVFNLSVVFESRVLGILSVLINALSLKHFGWFAAGALFYIYFQSKENKWFSYAIVVMLISAATVRIEVLGFDAEVIAGSFLISALFALSFKSDLLQKILQNKGLVFFGFISYPLYLIHENATASMIIKVAGFAPWMHSFLTPYLPMVMVVFVAYIIARYLEPILIKLFSFKKQVTTVLIRKELS